MTRETIAATARLLATLDRPISHAALRILASLPGSDWTLVDGAVFEAYAKAAAERRRADPEF